MSKIVTIPTDGGNPFVVILGGVKYVYKPGETVEVPDGVALEIEEWERWHKKYYGDNVPPFGAQPDLSQNDPNAPDYVKNRTHYVEKVNDWILPETKLTLSFDGDSYFLYEIDGSPLEPGKTYKVIYNGVEHSAEAMETPNGGAVIYLNDDVGKVMYFTDDEAFGIIDNSPFKDSTISVTIAIYVETEVVHKLDAKYIPDKWDGIICNNTIPVYISTGSVTLFEFDFAAIKNKLLAGNEVTVMLHSVFTYGNQYEQWDKSISINYNATDDIITLCWVSAPAYKSSNVSINEISISVNSSGNVVHAFCHG